MKNSIGPPKKWFPKLQISAYAGNIWLEIILFSPGVYVFVLDMISIYVHPVSTYFCEMKINSCPLYIYLDVLGYEIILCPPCTHVFGWIGKLNVSRIIVLKHVFVDLPFFSFSANDTPLPPSLSWIPYWIVGSVKWCLVIMISW